jgi:Skp family chaperone for outer membrane proteins
VTEQIAKEKGLELVLDKSEPQFDSVAPEDITLTIGLQKVLYNGGCPDITAEVIARLDAMD